MQHFLLLTDDFSTFSSAFKNTLELIYEVLKLCLDNWVLGAIVGVGIVSIAIDIIRKIIRKRK